MNLWNEADRIYREQGPEAAKRWEANLTPDQRAAMAAQWDQFAASLKEVPAALAEVAQGLKRMADQTKRMSEAFRSLPPPSGES